MSHGRDHLLRHLLLACALVLACAVLPAVAALAPAALVLHENAPAPDTPEGWERQALPIGNGRLGAMLFGQLARDRVSLNEITLWTGDAQVMGAYQPLANLVVELPGHEAASGYRRTSI